MLKRKKHDRNKKNVKKTFCYIYGTFAKKKIKRLNLFNTFMARLRHLLYYAR